MLKQMRGDYLATKEEAVAVAAKWKMEPVFT